MTSPGAHVAGIDPSTGRLWAHLVPENIAGGVDEAAVIAIVNPEITDRLNEFVPTFANAMPGMKVHAYQRDGVQSLRSVFTVRTDIFLIWVMPTEPAQGGGYAIPGDDWEPILASDAECDAQGLV